MVREVRSVESKIDQVTVYASGARVRRTATFSSGVPEVVRLVGLPLTVIDDTVRTEVEGAAVVIALRTGLDVPDAPAAAEETPELRAARRRVTLAETDIERLVAALGRLEDASLIEDDPSEEAPAAWAAIVAARRSLVALRAERELALRERLGAARREVEDAKRALDVEISRDLRAGSARAAKLHELRKYVELEMIAQGGGDVVIHVDYQVAAARWAPSYVARLDGDQARIELRAVVAQASGEDWTGVALELSTAEPERFTQLPELVPQKIGRRQLDAARRGFRAPPIGADLLFADYDRGFPRKAKLFTAAAGLDESTFEGRAPSPSDALDAAAFGQQNWDEESSRAKAFEPMGTPPPQMMMKRRGPPPGGALAGIMAPRAAAAADVPRGGEARAMAGGAPASVMPAVAPVPRLDYGALRMAGPNSAERGRLVPAPPSELDAEALSRGARALAAVADLVLPPGHDTGWAHTYDYAFASDGKVDVKSDAAWQSLAITARATTASVHHVAVPREQPAVFRIAAIANPLDGPLLPGPIDVYDRGQFLITSEVSYTPPSATVQIGLGVDPTVKVARNVEFREEASGMLRGALKLVHAITIDVENLSGRPIEIDVRERVPVTREGDDDIEVTLGKIEPAWERWTPDPNAPKQARLRGGYRWKVKIAAKGKQLLRAGYEVKIAGKQELVGGNRREP